MVVRAALFTPPRVPISVLSDATTVIMYFTSLKIRIYHMKRKAIRDISTGLYLGKNSQIDPVWVEKLADAWSTESLSTMASMALPLIKIGFKLDGIDCFRVSCDAYDCIEFITMPTERKESIIDHDWSVLERENMYYCPTCAIKRELTTDEKG